jgi:hypothetical protein
MARRTLWPLLLLLPACGEPPPAAPAPQGPDPEAASLFDPASAGTLTGQVRWKGAVPRVAPLRSLEDPLTVTVQAPPPVPKDWPNPHAPQVGARGGVASAVVFLRGVDPRRARPWDLPAVRVELRQHRFHVLQGTSDRPTGFVRAGECVSLVSRQKVLHVVQGRGSAFFALTLPEPGQARSRRLESPGVVELASGAGYFWMRAHLFVAQHPYFAHPDAEGNFRFDKVPPGEYEVVGWHPDWRLAGKEYNPDLLRVQQVSFQPAIEVSRRVRVEPRRTQACELGLP